ncbi:NUDIX hydrolase [Paenibacillus allorhizosphaerae]|uniref:NADH pyrophosphatase n=1 Tax=Paenibacillus allorhizosphaerae TaxID=2849866 RepID=A0ABN7TFJ3_9BACL|nr:NUDIX hydrolase [Paenibacillus allorhizosphaerae]CAG7618262.1 NADH pyrophosphatase [Paenibacillus allorhizosphaerae]
MGYVEDIRALVGHRPLILVGAVVIAVDCDGRLLLQQRKHPYGSWGIPGGLMELGESVEDTARRELLEETNLKAGELKLINVYSGQGQFIRAANGDEFYAVTTAFYTKEITGELVVDKSEALDFVYYKPDELPQQIVKSHKKIIDEFMSRHYRNL